MSRRPAALHTMSTWYTVHDAERFRGSLCMQPAYSHIDWSDPATSADLAEAKALCLVCPALDACREKAIYFQSTLKSIHGVWAGVAHIPSQSRKAKAEAAKPPADDTSVTVAD